MEDFPDEVEEPIQPPQDQREVKPVVPAPLAPTPEPTDVNAIIERYKNDPAEMAKALIERQKFIDRQAAEIGQLRKTPAPKIEETPTATPQGDKEFWEVENPWEQPAEPTPDPATPAPVETPDTADDTAPEPVVLIPQDKLYGPDTEVDEDTGWFVETDAEGNRLLVEPHDALGISYWPESRFAAIQRELLDKHDGNAIAATVEYNAILANYNEERNGKLREAAQRVSKSHDYYGKAVLPEVETVLAREGLTAEESKALSAFYANAARYYLDEGLKNGVITGPAVYDKDLLAKGIRILVQNRVYAGGIAEDLKQAMPNAPVVRQPVKQQPYATAPVASRSSATGAKPVSSSPAPWFGGTAEEFESLGGESKEWD